MFGEVGTIHLVVLFAVGEHLKTVDMSRASDFLIFSKGSGDSW